MCAHLVRGALALGWGYKPAGPQLWDSRLRHVVVSVGTRWYLSARIRFVSADTYPEIAMSESQSKAYAPRRRRDARMAARRGPSRPPRSEREADIGRALQTGRKNCWGK